MVFVIDKRRHTVHRRILGGTAAFAAVLALVLPLGARGLTQLGDGQAPADALAYVKIDNTGDGVEDVAYRWP